MNSLDRMEDYDRIAAALDEEKTNSNELRREIALLRKELILCSIAISNSSFWGLRESVGNAIDNTQATAEAYEREVASYEIANAASEFSDDEYREITYGAVYRKLIRMAEELKTNKVKNDRNNRSSKTQHNITS